MILSFIGSIILDIPMIHTLYPTFHPNRPRFFNTAAFYTIVVQALDNELTKYINEVRHSLRACSKTT